MLDIKIFVKFPFTKLQGLQLYPKEILEAKNPEIFGEILQKIDKYKWIILANHRILTKL